MAPLVARDLQEHRVLRVQLEPQDFKELVEQREPQASQVQLVYREQQDQQELKDLRELMVLLESKVTLVLQDLLALQELLVVEVKLELLEDKDHKVIQDQLDQAARQVLPEWQDLRVQMARLEIQGSPGQLGQ